MRICLLALVVACSAPARPTTTPPRVVVTPPPATPDAAPAPQALEPPQPALRLPRNFVPTAYDARLAIDPAKPTFEGTIAITGQVTEPSTVIWLHGRHLAVSRAAATMGDPYATPAGTTVAVQVTPKGEDLLELRAASPLAAGTWTLSLEYKGELDDINTTGAFKEKVAGTPYVFSQFEAIYARRVFPCLDEPDSKVPWKLTIEAPAGQTAVSNTPATRVTPLADGGNRFEFARTKPLPSYLIAFGVGPFDIVDGGKTKSGTPVRIVAFKGRGADAAYAAKTTAKIVDLLEEWFGIPYPYEKLDMLAIPVTVGFGAMENAGLVTFTERLILFDQAHPSWAKRHSWIKVASHELAHQWFGDLVTTAWWDDIWLNEGFANWMENKITARFEPAWHDELSELEMRDGALEADSVVSARQIRQPIATPHDILNAFDGITYDKGASVLNMFESYLGPEVFQKGVREYLKAKAFGNATSADFVAAIAAASGKDVAPAFMTFLDQPGEPELETKLTCNGKPKLDVTQHRFVPPGSPEPPATKPWILPVCVAYDADGKRAETCALLDGNGSIELAAKRCPRWVMPNVNGRGYYRNAYTAAQVTALRDEAWPQLTWTERRTVFFDVADAGRRARGRRGIAKAPSTQLPLTLALSLVPKMLAGGDRFTVGDALGLPVGLDRFVADDQRGKYEAWLRMTFAPGAEQLGLVPKDTDDLDAESNRTDLLHAAVWEGREPKLLEQAVELAAKWRELPVAVRGTILAIGVDANAELFDRTLKEIKTEPDRQKRDEMIGAVASVRDPARVQTALALLLDPAIDFRESMWMLFDSASEATRRVAESFFREHEAELVKRMPQDEVTGGVASVAWLFTSACDAGRRTEIVEYAQKHFATMPGGERVVQQAIETMDQCIASRAVLEPEIRAWLSGVKIPKPKAKPKK